jgi:peptide/nickel transport system substrate-binding protein
MYVQEIMRKVIYLILMIIVFSGCKERATTIVQEDFKDNSYKPAFGDTLVEGSIGEPSILIPMLASDSASHSVAGLIFNGLVKYDTDLSIIGDLAESWDISQDGLVITFHLRKGVKWTDGVEFTADDVMFGYKTIINEKTPTAYSEDYLQVKKAEALDRYTFRVSYEKPGI